MFLTLIDMSDGRGSPASSRVAAAVGGAGAHAGRWAIHPRLSSLQVGARPVQGALVIFTAFGLVGLVSVMLALSGIIATFAGALSALLYGQVTWWALSGFTATFTCARPALLYG